MPEPFSVKARGRHGTESLDLTIPVKLKNKHGITQGDIFVVEINSEGELTIEYERIHEAEGD